MVNHNDMLYHSVFYLQNDKLKHVRYLLSVKKLQDYLLKKYNRNITRASAKDLSLSDMLERISDGIQLYILCNLVMEIVASFLQNFMCSYPVLTHSQFTSSLTHPTRIPNELCFLDGSIHVFTNKIL